MNLGTICPLEKYWHILTPIAHFEKFVSLIKQYYLCSVRRLLIRAVLAAPKKFQLNIKISFRKGFGPCFNQAKLTIIAKQFSCLKPSLWTTILWTTGQD
jgi:hypothetical protein